MEQLRGRVRNTVVALDLYAAAAWVLLPQDRWSGRSYRAARQMYDFLPSSLQLRVNGLALVFLTAVILFAAARHAGRTYAIAAGLIVAFWSWWTVLFAWSAITDPRAGALAPGLIAAIAALHLILAATPRA